jgi:hypothetical protein
MSLHADKVLLQQKHMGLVEFGGVIPGGGGLKN